MLKWFILTGSATALSVCAFNIKSVENIPIPVEIKKTEEGYSLLRGGESYFIKGAGGHYHFDRLKAYGGNSFRLWSTDGAEYYLDSALKYGLTVTLGLEMKLERHGFNYSDKKAVQAQLERLKKEVLKYKDHPALLMWGVGNELDQFAKNFAVWDAVNDLAKFIHETDPDHPTTTMLAGVPSHHIREILRRCPHLDILSINAFKDLPWVRQKITLAGWKGPYLIGEFGPSGYWESELLPWGTFIEETGEEKARVCQERYAHIISNSDRCLGSYVYYWGYKQARTHTLLSLFSESGEETAVIDVMQKEWTGRWPENRTPLISPVGIDDKTIQSGIYLKPGTQHSAFANATDPENDPLTYKWELYPESKEKKEGGDPEKKPEKIAGLFIELKGQELVFKTPVEEGAYRLFVYVFDGKNNVATANAPFYVKK